MMFLQISLTLVLGSSYILASSGSKSYDGYSTYNVKPDSEKKFKFLLRMAEENSNYDVWTVNRNDLDMDVMVAPKAKKRFEDVLNDKGIDYDVKVADVGATLRNEKEEQVRALMNRFGSEGNIEFDRYLRYDEIKEYMQFLAKKFKHLCSMDMMGKTYEGKETYVLKISSNPGAQKPVYILEGGMHAREWAGVGSVLYAMNQLVENNTYHKHLLENLDWYVVPVLNIDGYEYTHTSDRMWRKTRSKNGACYGVDPNRNFPYHWGESGSSTNPCTETYQGPAPLSEKEVQNIRTLGLSLKSRLAGYTAVHSYGQYFLYPWGYSKTPSKDEDVMNECAEEAAAAIKAFSGNSWTVGSAAGVLYEAAGGSDDFFKAYLNLTHSYTLEVTGGGRKGFDLPPSQLKSVVAETFEGLKVIAKYVAKDKTTRSAVEPSSSVTTKREEGDVTTETSKKRKKKKKKLIIRRSQHKH